MRTTQRVTKPPWCADQAAGLGSNSASVRIVPTSETVMAARRPLPLTLPATIRFVALQQDELEEAAADLACGAMQALGALRPASPRS